MVDSEKVDSKCLKSIYSCIQGQRLTGIWRGQTDEVSIPHDIELQAKPVFSLYAVRERCFSNSVTWLKA
jgi:hypothetical protein